MNDADHSTAPIETLTTEAKETNQIEAIYPTEYNGYPARQEHRRSAFAAVDTVANEKTEEMSMDDFEGKSQARQLHGWVISPEEQGSLKLVLQYGAGSDPAGDHEGLVQLLLPPEAALYLADELNRQAQRTLDGRTRRVPSADASDARGSTSHPPSRSRKS